MHTTLAFLRWFSCLNDWFFNGGNGGGEVVTNIKTWLSTTNEMDAEPNISFAYCWHCDELKPMIQKYFQSLPNLLVVDRQQKYHSWEEKVILMIYLQFLPIFNNWIQINQSHCIYSTSWSIGSHQTKTFQRITWLSNAHWRKNSIWKKNKIQKMQKQSCLLLESIWMVMFVARATFTFHEYNLPGCPLTGLTFQYNRSCKWM